ncbi:unnamed protein product [Angiostrongylus costaricensis]|uniref:CUB domain-containing protein n=1 Tax=Angiostrongylus costaricensis TaxID=334426 RepID=A0A0R3PCQ6_ANGCS|nr:unnamed protein product [Angiostrongylus costaricensis]
MKADPENRIMVEILEVDMEAQLFRSCLDYIGFHDGNQARLTPPYLSFCGQLRNRQVTSQSDSLTILFISDELVEGRGVKLSYEAVSFGECDIGWLSRGDGMCYRHVEAEPKVGWADAQCEVSQPQNMALESFGHTPSHSWIGYTDADHEGTLMGVNSKLNTIWPQPLLPGNSDERDCLYLDYSLSDREPYRIADCRTKQTFICQKRNTFLKKQYQNRVHNTESNRLVRGLDIQSQLNQPQQKEASNAQVNFHGAPAQPLKLQKAVQLSPVQADVHVNPTETGTLPKPIDEQVPQNSGTRLLDREKEQLAATNAAVQSSAVPPRNLPPLSIRETTLHSINTRQAL